MMYSGILIGTAWVRGPGAQRLVKLDGWVEPDGPDNKTVTKSHPIIECGAATEEKKAKALSSDACQVGDIVRSERGALMSDSI